MQPLIIIFGAASALALGGAAMYLVEKKSPQDLGGTSPTSIQAAGTTPRHDILGPVGTREATKRANANGEDATRAAMAGQTYVAPTVIASAQPVTTPDAPDPEFSRRATTTASVVPQREEPRPEPQPVQQIIYYVQAPPPAPVQAGVPTPSPQQVQRINSQIEALLTPSQGGFVVQRYAKPDRPETTGSGGIGRGAGGIGIGAPGNLVVARAGDTAYALIDRAFNSDDPQAPIFATIHDIDERGEPGPLHQVRMMGQITYSREQAAVLFTQLVLQDGRQIPMRAIAVSEDTARTGIAKDVDRHLLERYGSLFVSGLIQGAGQVGQLLVASSNNIVVNPLTGQILSSQNNAPYYQAGLGALLPAGQALTSAAAANFARPPTISAPAGMGIGIVFLDPVALPRPIANLR